jgi:sulfur carrier protein
MIVRVSINGQPHELDPGTTLAGAIAMVPGAPDGRGVAAALDGEVVPRRAWEETELADGARVELVVAVQGG